MLEYATTFFLSPWKISVENFQTKLKKKNVVFCFWIFFDPQFSVGCMVSAWFSRGNETLLISFIRHNVEVGRASSGQPTHCVYRLKAQFSKVD